MVFKKQDLINYSLLLACFLLGFYLSGCTVLFGAEPNRTFVLWEAVLVFVGFILAASGLIVFNILKNKYKPNIVILGILGFFFLYISIVILAYQTKTFSFLGVDNDLHNVTYAASISDKFVYVMALFCRLSMCFIILDVVHKNTNVVQLMKVTAILVLATLFVFFIISVVKHGENYLLFYEHMLDGDIYRYSVISVFETKNAYALVLLIGIFASLMMHNLEKKWYWLLAAGLVYWNIIHTISKLVILIGGILILGYLLFIFFVTYKQHKKTNLIALASVGGSLLLLLVVGIIVLSSKGKLVSFLEDLWITRGYDTFESRTWIWNKAAMILNNTNWFTGVGHVLFGRILHECNIADTATAFANNRYSAHCGYLQFIGDGGILFLLLGVAVITYYIYMNIKIFKTQMRISILSLSFITGMLIFMSLESVSIFVPNSCELGLMSLITITPTLFFNEKNKVTC